MAGVRPPQTIRVPGTGPTHPLDNAIKRQLARVPQTPAQRSAAQNSLKNTTNNNAAPAPVNGGGGASSSGVTISTATPEAETAGATGDPGHTGLASDAGHVHPMPLQYPVEVQIAGAAIGTRSTLNFLSGATASDNPGTDSVDIVISGGGGGGGVLRPTGGVPLVASLTWLNQGAAIAITNGDGSLTLERIGGGVPLSGLYMPAPPTPYTWTIGYIPHLWLNGFPNNLMLLYDSVAGAVYTFSARGLSNVANMVLSQWPTPAASTVNDLVTDPYVVPSVQYQRIADDGVNRTYSWSSDGVNFEQIYTNTSSYFIIPDSIGIGVTPALSPNKVGMTLVYWNVV